MLAPLAPQPTLEKTGNGENWALPLRRQSIVESAHIVGAISRHKAEERTIRACFRFVAATDRISGWNFRTADECSGHRLDCDQLLDDASPEFVPVPRQFGQEFKIAICRATK